HLMEALTGNIHSDENQYPTTDNLSSLILNFPDVLDMDMALPLVDDTLDLLSRVRLGVPLHHHDVLHHDLSGPSIDLDHPALLSLVPAGNDFHDVVLLQPDLHRLHRLPASNRHLNNLRSERHDFHEFLI